MTKTATRHCHCSRRRGEGFVAKSTEEQTVRLPSRAFLWLALGSIATSLTLKISGPDKDALFVGQGRRLFCYSASMISS